jgi:hypothetical protein
MQWQAKEDYELGMTVKVKASSNLFDQPTISQ